MKPANDNKPITFISMFSGIEAASVAFKPLGWHALAFAEIDKFPSAILAHHYPDVPNVGDMAKHDWAQYAGKADIVCGGPPCQAFSVAGLRAGMDDPRGQLSIIYMRALHAIKPRNAIIENVPGWLSSADNAFGCFLAGLVGADDALPPPAGRKWPNAGMVAGPKGRAAWRILDAQYFGLAQRRKRVIVIADFGNGADPAAVLFERAGMQGNIAPRRETGKDIAAYAASGLGNFSEIGAGGVGGTIRANGGDVGGGTENLVTFDRQSNCEYGDADLASTVSARDYKSPTDLVAYNVQCITGEITHALKAEGADASEDGTGRSNPIVFGWQNSSSQGLSDSEHVSPTLDKSKTPAVADWIGIGVGECSGTLRANQGSGFRSDVSPVEGVAITASSVRRLTPVECERLQGFPDSYTNIPYRGKPTSPDGPRYKALGNSWAVPKFTWIGKRIARFMPVNDNDNKKAAA